MADKFSKDVRSHIMAAIRQKNTKPELKVFKELRKRRVYFQKHYKKVVGTPDIALPRKKIAIFIDGDFWHGFRYPLWKSRLPSKFWKNKIERNRLRDKETFSILRTKGWKTLRVWEHQVNNDFDKTMQKITNLLKQNLER